MKINIIMVALIAVSGSASAQWIELDTHYTKLAMVQQACQEKGNNYEVPTIQYLKDIKELNRNDRGLLIGKVAEAFGGESRFGHYTSPYFLADDNGLAKEAQVNAYRTGLRINNIEIRDRNFEAYVFDVEEPSESRATDTPENLLHNAVNDYISSLHSAQQLVITPPVPLSNVCVQSGV
ncbi:hypothetical protein [Psychromonas sp. Urea-02u-13]|uniref:hypothetical protein n=1 Tax=Psychromonas sp. Urea-02u-13 TaxID=2058326 RepID=UPI000C33BC83|nr:hypothetical protein [Psychromonas sp. Urea-02u-13]PKG36949.1 hypothetical protein CXF74_21480 [Psychromonas sp. Urea-02u-13]